MSKGSAHAGCRGVRRTAGEMCLTDIDIVSQLSIPAIFSRSEGRVGAEHPGGDQAQTVDRDQPRRPPRARTGGQRPAQADREGDHHQAHGGGGGMVVDTPPDPLIDLLENDRGLQGPQPIRFAIWIQPCSPLASRLNACLLASKPSRVNACASETVT